MTAYATPADFLLRYDYRPTADLVSDTGTAVPQNLLATDQPLLTALAAASGEVESALIVGGRYLVSQLSALTGNSLENLKDFVCELAAIRLEKRRMNMSAEQIDALAKLQKMANDRLQLLRTGESLFNLADAISASVVSADGPTTLAIESLNLIRDRVGTSYYPPRTMPYGR